MKIKLADSTQIQTKEIQQIIDNNIIIVSKMNNMIINSTEFLVNTLKSVADLGKYVENVNQITKEDRIIIDTLQQNVDVLITLAETTEHAVNEQKIALDEMTKSITSINESIQENVINNKKNSSNADALNNATVGISQKIEFFKFDKK